MRFWRSSCPASQSKQPTGFRSTASAHTKPKRVEQACQLAIEDDDWCEEREDHECSGQTYVTGAWAGEDTAYCVAALAVPSQFGEDVQRKADHFETLLAILKALALGAGGRTVGLAALAAARRRPRSPKPRQSSPERVIS
jgi:hypothetical protein